MSRWWRAYDECVDDPKLLLLSDASHRAWFNLLCVASAYGGTLPSIDILSVKLRMKAAKVQAHIGAFISAELIDQTETGLQPHNWNGRQYKSDVSTERVKRFRNGGRNVSETPPETEEETERKKDAEPSGSHPKTDEADLFDRGKKVLGTGSGGLIAKLLKSKKGSVPLARAAIEQASEKQNPREYIGRVLSGPAAVLMENGERHPEGII